jgi:thioesterase domain-containing protein
MEEVAAAHIKTIRSIQPKGPYLLGGYCTGGRVIYEMGRQLRDQGQTVDLVVSIEPDVMVYALPVRAYYAAFQVVSKLFQFSETRQVYWGLGLKHIVRRLFYKMLRKTDPYPLTFAQLRDDYGRLCDWLALGYRPSGMYEGKFTLFWAEEGEVAKTLRTGWRKIEANGNVEIHIIPGTHGTCKREYVSVLAEHLADCIQRAQQS